MTRSNRKKKLDSLCRCEIEKHHSDLIFTHWMNRAKEPEDEQPCIQRFVMTNGKYQRKAIWKMI
jgi:hypothetical protein